ncbi:MAG TPA: hypothetical protein VGF75_00715 [Candidatus Saccharimonadales bacterium]
MAQHPSSNEPIGNQQPLWSDADLRRVSRVLEILIRVDQRKKKERRGVGNN